MAAFAYGTEMVKPVDTIAGPGGPWFHVAKRLVRDFVRTDLPAGPSEGIVLADGSISPTQVAWDTLIQAEHGPDSAGICVTCSSEYAQKVAGEIDKALQNLPKSIVDRIAENTKNYSCILLFKDLDGAVQFINEYAPEHLSIDSKLPDKIYRRYRDKIRHVGTIFLNTPMSAGDFGLGPNSTLPTGGAAKLYSGLSVDVFIKKPTIEKLTVQGLKRMKNTVTCLAEYEGFPAHAQAMKHKH